MRIRGDAGSESRFDSRAWRDKRFIVGLLLVLAATVLGGFAVAAADRTVGYWATGSAVRAGEPVHREDLVAVRAKVPKRTARSLLPTDAALPDRMDRLVWAADVRSGTLVTIDLLEPRRRTVELPLVVPAGGIPSDLRPGDRIDVWASGAERADTPGPARRIMSGVRVVARSSTTNANGGAGFTVVVNAVGVGLDGRLVAAASSGRITIVRVS